MKLIPIEDPEAPAYRERKYVTEDGYFIVEFAGNLITVTPSLPYISGIASQYSLIEAMMSSRDRMLESISILTIRINQLNKMIEEEKQKSVKSDLYDPSDLSVSPENEKPADTPNAAGSSDNTSPSI